MTGILDDIAPWHQPITWKVGDTIDAATWVDRVYNPLNLLLRRPLTIATQSADTTVGSASTGNVFTFDTLVVDNDGMMNDDGSSTFSKFYAQRDGIFQVYMSAPFVGNGSSHDRSLKVTIFCNTTPLYANEAPLVGSTSGQDHWRSVNGAVSMTEGDYIQIKVDNNNLANVTIKAQLNAPRLCIMWARPFLS